MLSGHKSAIDRVAEIGKKYGVRRAVPLPVSAPFHCALMQPAADAMAEALANVDGPRPGRARRGKRLGAADFRSGRNQKRLVEQVTGTVRWRECVATMAANGITDFYEIGAGKVLAGLVKRTAATCECVEPGTPADIEAAGSLSPRSNFCS